MQQFVRCHNLSGGHYKGALRTKNGNVHKIPLLLVTIINNSLFILEKGVERKSRMYLYNSARRTSVNLLC